MVTQQQIRAVRSRGQQLQLQANVRRIAQTSQARAAINKQLETQKLQVRTPSGISIGGETFTPKEFDMAKRWIQRKSQGQSFGASLKGISNIRFRKALNLLLKNPTIKESVQKGVEARMSAKSLGFENVQQLNNAMARQKKLGLPPLQIPITKRFDIDVKVVKTDIKKDIKEQVKIPRTQAEADIMRKRRINESKLTVQNVANQILVPFVDIYNQMFSKKQQKNVKVFLEKQQDKGDVIAGKIANTRKIVQEFFDPSQRDLREEFERSQKVLNTQFVFLNKDIELFNKKYGDIKLDSNKFVEAEAVRLNLIKRTQGVNFLQRAEGERLNRILKKKDADPASFFVEIMKAGMVVPFDIAEFTVKAGTRLPTKTISETIKGIKGVPESFRQLPASTTGQFLGSIAGSLIFSEIVFGSLSKISSKPVKISGESANTARAVSNVFKKLFPKGKRGSISIANLKQLNKTRFDALGDLLSGKVREIAKKGTLKEQLTILAKIRRDLKTPAEIAGYKKWVQEKIIDAGILHTPKYEIVGGVTVKGLPKGGTVVDVTLTKPMPKGIFAQTQPIITTQAVTQSTKQQLKFLTPQVTKQAQLSLFKSQQTQVQQAKQIQQAKQASATAQAQTSLQKQQQKLLTKTILLSKQQIKAGRKIIRPIRGKIVIPIPKLKNTSLVKALKKIKKSGKGVDVFVGQKIGRRRKIYSNIQPFTALKKASRFVDKNIEASFRLKRTSNKAKGRRTKAFNLSPKFRPSRKNPLFIVEKRKFRLDSPFEKLQLKTAKAKARKVVRKRKKRK